mmetsp:Transcript_27304/g.41296  ORF Transcript_27304/g.41296 Transcript_27304/m.41296 type:complete len:794 (+) Transcript_27304:100-2481(+)
MNSSMSTQSDARLEKGNQGLADEFEMESEDDEDVLMELVDRENQNEGGTEFTSSGTADGDRSIASPQIQMLSPSMQADDKGQLLNVCTARLSPISPLPARMTPPVGRRRSRSVSLASLDAVSNSSKESSEANVRLSPIQIWSGPVDAKESHQLNVQNALQTPVSMRKVSSTPNSFIAKSFRSQGEVASKMDNVQKIQTSTVDSLNDGSVLNREYLDGGKDPKALTLPVKMRRAASSPNSAPEQFLKSAISRKSFTPKVRNRSKSFASNISRPYNFQRHLSLPYKIESEDSSGPLLSEDFIRSYSSDSSIVEDNVNKKAIAKDAEDLDAVHDKENIFRSGTPTELRISPAGNQQQQRQRTNYLYTIGTGKTDGSEESLELAKAGNEIHHLEVVSDRSETTMEIPTYDRINGLQTVLFLSIFASFGTLLRIFSGRLFGFDCEIQTMDPINDWFTPFSKHICVTSSGMTNRYGGALFTDLPANMIGSFIMGLLTNSYHSAQPLPWLSASHPLQKHTILHVAIKTGMCGSLTTFASWNSQMVAMLDGSQCVLGSQVDSALFGYLIGIMTAVSSFVLGTNVSLWLANARGARMVVAVDTDDHDELSRTDNVENPPHHINTLGKKSKVYWKVKRFLSCGTSLPFFVFAGILVGCLVGDFIANIAFYRFLWMDLALSPLGALLRWFLALRFNGVSFWGVTWLPWGTLLANLLACILSILILSLESRYQSYFSDRMWSSSILIALRVGCAGSLSTVSTFVKELVELSKKYPLEAKSYYYGFITIAGSMLLSVALYALIVRV